MKEILEELSAFGGVYHGCIVREGRILSTTFPSLLNENLTSIAKITDRIFKGASSVNHSYNEIYFEMEENYLLGYPIESGLIIVLLTGKSVNFALIHMTVQSASTQLVRDAEIASRFPEESPLQPAMQNGAHPKIDQNMKPLLNEILESLTLHIGPVARITMGEALKTWRLSFKPTKKNLPVLVTILAKDIDNENARQSFLDDLNTLLI